METGPDRVEDGEEPELKVGNGGGELHGARGDDNRARRRAYRVQRRRRAMLVVVSLSCLECNSNFLNCQFMILSSNNPLTDELPKEFILFFGQFLRPFFCRKS